MIQPQQRRPHRKRYKKLDYKTRWEIACKLFLVEASPKDLSYEYETSLTSIHRIKYEFIRVIEVWDDTKAPPEQLTFSLRRKS